MFLINHDNINDDDDDDDKNNDEGRMDTEKVSDQPETESMSTAALIHRGNKHNVSSQACRIVSVYTDCRL